MGAWNVEPTAGQLRYLRQLAELTCTSFSPRRRPAGGPAPRSSGSCSAHASVDGSAATTAGPLAAGSLSTSQSAA
jgi:hypothetical protein